MIAEPERRDFMRLAVDTEASVQRLDTDLKLRVTMVDLSASGFAFLTDQPFSPGEAVEVIITSPSGSVEPFQRPGTVVRTATSEGEYLVGVKFHSGS
ncbi:PilZ domain-containing protein [Thioalkalivibrio sp.]|uniref:PilZ domain-containing protein n=1 Tax=Thioalkalivibrio sp. TaxID=2093813 RepID=UPI0039771C25